MYDHERIDLVKQIPDNHTQRDKIVIIKSFGGRHSIPQLLTKHEYQQYQIKAFVFLVFCVQDATNVCSGQKFDMELYCSEAEEMYERATSDAMLMKTINVQQIPTLILAINPNNSGTQYVEDAVIIERLQLHRWNMKTWLYTRNMDEGMQFLSKHGVQFSFDNCGEWLREMYL